MARSLGEEPHAAEIAALVAFSDLFMNWNARINLGGMRTAEELVERHLRDAFAADRFVASGDRVVDVGSGGGLPGIPMALLKPGAHFDLFEPTAKKVAFLRTAVRELAIGGRVRIHSARLKTPLPDECRGTFDVACSRATFAPAAWVPFGFDLVREGGRVLVFATADPAAGCPVPNEELMYGPNRRLLIFRRQVSRGT